MSDLEVALNKYNLAKEKEKILLLNIDPNCLTIVGVKYVDDFNQNIDYFKNDMHPNYDYETVKIESILDLVELFCIEEKELSVLKPSIRFHLKNRLKTKSLKYHKQRLSEIFSTPEKVKVLGKMYKTILNKRLMQDAQLPNAVIIKELELAVHEASNIAA